MKRYVVLDNRDSSKYAIIGSSVIPKNIICEAPTLNGEYVKDISIVKVKTMWFDSANALEKDDSVEPAPQGIHTYKKAFVDPILKASRDSLALQVAENEKWDKMRRERDRLLKETDYIMMPDYPLVNKAPYENYRQALRDLPSTITDINSFSWPVKPS